VQFVAGRGTDMHKQGWSAEGPQRVWLIVFQRYVVFRAIAHLVWEVLHLPPYAHWQAETPFRTALFLARCIVGDVAIALSSLVIALLLVMDGNWPARSYDRVGALAVALGLAGAVLTEWLNVEILYTWAYSDLMPVVPLVNTRLSPGCPVARHPIRWPLVGA
jgi:hypothetical protein